MEVNSALSPAAQHIIEMLLSVRCGTPVRITGVRTFAYSAVSRCTLEATGGTAPPTVIVRVPRPDARRSGLARLRNEHAALELLSALASTLAPRFIAGDAIAGLLVSDDLGAHPSLLDLLLGDDAVAARQGLLAFARGPGNPACPDDRAGA